MSTNIQWTDETWNPIVGCSRVPGSPACANCYAATAAQSARLQRFPQYQAVSKWDGTVEFVESQLLKPLSWKKPKRIFVCSMSDLFHENVPDEWIDKVLAVASICPQHTFQILTKRPERAQLYFNRANRFALIDYQAYEILRAGRTPYTREHPVVSLPLKNCWIGTTVENQDLANKRIPVLLQIPAAVRFLSCEPLLEAIDLSQWLICPECQGEQLWYEKHTGSRSGVAGRKQCPKCKDNRFYSDLNWAIIGAESGNGARPSRIENIESVVTQLSDAKLPVFVKQLGQFPVTNSPDKFPKTELITRQKYSHSCFEQATKLGFELSGMYCVKLSDKKGGDIAEFPSHLQIRQFPVELINQTQSSTWSKTMKFQGEYFDEIVFRASQSVKVPCVLTDGQQIAQTEYMTPEEFKQAEQNAQKSTDGNWYWSIACVERITDYDWQVYKPGTHIRFNVVREHYNPGSGKTTWLTVPESSTQYEFEHLIDAVAACLVFHKDREYLT